MDQPGGLPPVVKDVPDRLPPPVFRETAPGRLGARRLQGSVSPAYIALAIVGMVAGAFYASIIGPLVVFFPKI